MGGPVSLAAQAGGATHVLIVTGLSGEPRFATTFHSAASTLYDAAKARWGVADSNLVYLAEDPALDPRIRGRATRENLAAAFASVARRSAAGDVVLVVLIGHGSGEGGNSRLSLPGPDPSAADFASWLKPLAGRTTVLVNASSGSGDFLAALADSGRIVITATKSAFERNETIFAGIFARGLGSGEADADKDGRVSVLEAFQYAKREVARGYESRSLLLTEHAQLSDSGLARRVAFGTQAAPTDPRIAALYAERRALEAQVDALRRKKGTLDSLVYQRELERLLLELAGKTAAIRAVEARKP
ncbi:MAG TPA: hypothetical protein VGQ73_09165 [Gemmatimonadales bacterium]|jgi:hypothetical protein|nr:hypothetical protein [Gemmatimonadales bacterium]